MAADGWLIRRRMRARWPSTLALAALVALTSLIAFLAIGTAQRTRDAYPSFLRHSRVGDLVINPSLVSTDIDRAIRDLPGVEAVTTDSLLFGESTTPSFAGDATGLDNFVQIRGSADGRFEAMDRPAISAGRLPTGRSEAFISASVAKAADLHLGDELQLTFGNARDDVDLLADGTDHAGRVGNGPGGRHRDAARRGAARRPLPAASDPRQPRRRPPLHLPARRRAVRGVTPTDHRRRPAAGLRTLLPVLLAPAPRRRGRGRRGRGRLRREGRRAQQEPS